VATEARRAELLNRWLQDRTCTRIEPARWGDAVFNDDFPQRYFSNFVRVDRALAAGPLLPGGRR